MFNNQYLVGGLLLFTSIFANADMNEDFFKRNTSKLGVSTLSSGIQYEILESGLGGIPNNQHKIHFSYTVRNLDYSTRIEMAEKEVNLSDLNEPMIEAIKTMKKTGKSRFFIPASKASNFDKLDKNIPSNIPLIIDIHLHNFL
ncbi:peptidylprolyl isomerase [Acinetobacter pollinis]|uniref:FKBP-type peptidyl-prolyl cis-trans isomerase N-terminal domain-containing protein n=1 Tax=Acinetobacter pollinis TaxID=2605270 RepID=UPI0018A2687C|nr:FKBP-type peptidyl-prolyl cis-trans isomerase N-terminal domain-containing protein [Acinetobacter pollinis]MBF7691647.1 hypothetical protein [Acinetobacter pollinis]MBF7699294.1 hypothetical protein [Acinetobacter pollinis]